MTHDASTGRTVFHGSPSQPQLTLDEVLSYKYLGAPLGSSPRNMLQAFNKQVRDRAHPFLVRVLSLVKTGPDRPCLAQSLWAQIDLPSIRVTEKFELEWGLGWFRPVLVLSFG